MYKKIARVFFIFSEILFWISLLINLGSCDERESLDPCNPKPSPDAEHYIIGYGSLMESSSRLRTYKGTHESTPVQVKGFRREWNKKSEKLHATVLGAVVDASFSINSVIFKLPPSSNPMDPNSIEEAMEQYDKREVFYCRQKVDVKNIKALKYMRSINHTREDFLGQSSNKSKYWIYINQPELVEPPCESYPIVQSYVDVFISGCIELEEQYNLRNFARKCVTSTKLWSKTFSVNDRLSPRYPTVHRYSPAKIDAVLGGLGQNEI